MEKEENMLLPVQTGQMCRVLCAIGRPRNPWILRRASLSQDRD